MFDFYKGKNVFVTGHTGFKGSWLCEMLLLSGANVVGYSLEAENPSLFNLTTLKDRMVSIIGDVRDYDSLKAAFDKAHPEIVFHLAAQPIVRTSYDEPRYTYETNVMGTVNLLDCIRLSDGVKSFVNVTTDKVYENNDDDIAFIESQKLCGYDPYSNSKSCSELVTYSYYNAFFKDKNIAVSTMRAGNVIGGGDFAKDRLVPDCIRAWQSNDTLIIRNPNSTRPFQHVIEPLCAYMLVAQEQYKNHILSSNYNVGPNQENCITVSELCSIFSAHTGVESKISGDNGPHEAKKLSLNCEKIKNTFNWNPLWNAEEAIKRTIDFVKQNSAGESASNIIKQQISEYVFMAGKRYD